MLSEVFSKEILEIADIQQKQEDTLLSKSNVVGVAIAPKVSEGEVTGETGITVYVTHKLDKELLSKEDMVPKTINGIKTDVVETGDIFALSDTTLRNRIRPAEGGYSVGHYKITAGTIATCVVDRLPAIGKPKNYYILSNNHVLANSNDARIGDPIFQPGPYDGGTKKDTIARLSRFVPIRFDGKCNYVDAAIAEGDFDDLDREIYWTGYVDGIVPPKVGMVLHKTGRTTGHTTGRITGINATVNVNYGGGKIAKFCRQIITTDMSAGGDSGSLMVDAENRAVGLLFAGSSTVTIANDIRYVLSMLKIKFH